MRRYKVDTQSALWRIVDGDAVIISATTSRYYSLNATGTHIWELLAEAPRTLPEIVEEVSDRYGRQRHEVAPDVEELLAELESENLIQADG